MCEGVCDGNVDIGVQLFYTEDIGVVEFMCGVYVWGLCVEFMCGGLCVGFI